MSIKDVASYNYYYYTTESKLKHKSSSGEMAVAQKQDEKVSYSYVGLIIAGSYELTITNRSELINGFLNYYYNLFEQ